jgi:hypothetical protein
MTCGPLPRGIELGVVQEPSTVEAVILASGVSVKVAFLPVPTVTLSNTCTRLPASDVPLNVGVMTFVMLSELAHLIHGTGRRDNITV